MNKIMHWMSSLAICAVLLAGVGCGKGTVQTVNQPKLDAVKWNLPVGWNHEFDHQPNLKEPMQIEAFGQGGRYMIQVEFVDDEAALLERINFIREKISLPKIDAITLGRADVIEQTLGRMKNFQSLVGDVQMHGVRTIYSLNQSITPIQAKDNFALISAIRYDQTRYCLAWSVGKDSLRQNIASYDTFVDSFRFPRIGFESAMKLAYSQAQIEAGMMPARQVAMKLAQEKMAAEKLAENKQPKKPEVKSADTKKGIQWDLPKGWVKQPGNMFAFANFAVGGDKKLLVKVTRMGMAIGDFSRNLQRWKGEVGPNATGGEPREIKIDGVAGKLFEFNGPGVSGSGPMTSHVIMLVRGNSTWFFKLIGPKEGVAKTKKEFDGWIDSIRF